MLSFKVFTRAFFRADWIPLLSPHIKLSTDRQDRGARDGDVESIRSKDKGYQSANSSFAPPSMPMPIVTYSALAIIAVIFLFMWYVGKGNIASISVMFGAKDNDLIRQGQWWRFITPIFLHGSFEHLIVNAFSLWQIGISMERIYGSKKYFVILIVAGIAGNLLSYALSPTLSLGASGALFGLVGAGLVFPVRFHQYMNPEDRRKILSQLATMAVINLALGFMLRGIVDNWAHIGGLVGGAVVALFFIPDSLLDEDRFDSVGNIFASILSSALCGVILFAGIMQWSSKAQKPDLKLVTYTLQQPDPWWSIGMAPKWKLKDGFWISPEGAVAKISSSDEDPVVREEVLSMIGSKKPANITIDGMTGWDNLIKTKEEVKRTILIFAYGRGFAFTLNSPLAAYTPQVQAEVETSLKHLRFFHAPRQ